MLLKQKRKASGSGGDFPAVKGPGPTSGLQRVECRVPASVQHDSYLLSEPTASQEIQGSQSFMLITQRSQWHDFKMTSVKIEFRQVLVTGCPFCGNCSLISRGEASLVIAFIGEKFRSETQVSQCKVRKEFIKVRVGANGSCLAGGRERVRKNRGREG